ncbi:MAG: LPS export ABC transporter ATP-binding protein [Pseudomonadota bacterium]
MSVVPLKTARSSDEKPAREKASRCLVGAHLTKVIGQRPILHDVSLYVEPGEAVGLLGTNGAGKTTCFHIMMGLLGPDSGSVLLADQDITPLPLYRRAQLGMGYLPQESSVFRTLSVSQNIQAVLELTQVERHQHARIVGDLLAEFSLSHLSRAPAYTLSGGERRRVEIARALACNPQFILLDEPLAGIDPIAVDDIKGLVKSLCKRGIGVLITDHNARETMDLVHRIYVLHGGHIIKTGTPDIIARDRKVRDTYLGEKFSL